MSSAGPDTSTADTAEHVDDTDVGPASRQPFLDRIARPALALGAGVLVALSLPPWGFWPLAIVGVALLRRGAGCNTDPA